MVDKLARYRLHPRSGRQHQLRVHMMALGAPILNDLFYPDVLPVGEDNFERPLKLLARSIAFDDPVSGQSALLEEAHVLPSAQASAGVELVRRVSGGGKSYLFAINHTDSEATLHATGQRSHGSHDMRLQPTASIRIASRRLIARRSPRCGSAPGRRAHPR